MSADFPLLFLPSAEVTLLFNHTAAAAAEDNLNYNTVLGDTRHQHHLETDNLAKETTTRMADNKEDDVTIMKEVGGIFCNNNNEHFHDYFTTVCTLAVLLNVTTNKTVLFSRIIYNNKGYKE